MCRAVFERHLQWRGIWTKKEKKREEKRKEEKEEQMKWT